MAQQTTAPAKATSVTHISPARLQVIIAGLWLSLFLSALDTTIITTGLIKISSSFDALSEAAWLVTTYLLTYNSFLMITAKLSDVWGLKTMLVLGNVFFLVFSMACSGAQTMTQLIVFRAFQGIGGSACYSLVFVSIMKLITPEKMGFYSGIISSVFALANLLGPIIGGVISDHTTWRWIFWLNGPVVVAAIIILAFSMPNLEDGKSIRERLQGFDTIGGILSVCWPIPLLFALQEGGASYAWKSSVIVGTLVAGLLGLLIFGVYETRITYRTKKEAIFPVKFLSNPAMMLLLLSMFLLGMPFYAAIIQLPQRFQAVNGTSAARAGILLLPLSLLTPVGAMAAGMVMGRFVHAEYILIIATTLVSLGIGLLSSLPTGHDLPATTYGYEIITGIGLGMSSPPYYFLLGTTLEEKDVATGTGALNMLRTLGGCVAVAICSALQHSTLKSKLAAFLSPEQLTAIDSSITVIHDLPRELQEKVGQAFGKSYNKQFQVLIAFACLNVLVAIALGIVRKRMGIFGRIPERKAGNEFLKAPEEEANAEGAQNNKGNDIEKTAEAKVVKAEAETTETKYPADERVDEVSVADKSGSLADKEGGKR